MNKKSRPPSCALGRTGFFSPRTPFRYEVLGLGFKGVGFKGLGLRVLGLGQFFTFHTTCVGWLLPLP